MVSYNTLLFKEGTSLHLALGQQHFHRETVISAPALNVFYVLYFQCISQPGDKCSGLIQLTFFQLFPKIKFHENLNTPSKYVGFAENGQREVKIISSSLFHFNAETFYFTEIRK